MVPNESTISSRVMPMPESSITSDCCSGKPCGAKPQAGDGERTHAHQAPRRKAPGADTHLDLDGELLLALGALQALVREGLEAHLVQRVAGVGHQLSQEHLLVAVDAVHDQVQQPAHLHAWDRPLSKHARKSTSQAAQEQLERTSAWNSFFSPFSSAAADATARRPADGTLTG
eukprot:scaffold310_cov302-Prasinococcus_capsulatus_cf.AAC.7